MCQCPVPWRGVYKAKPLRCGGWSACGWGPGFQPWGTHRACSTGHQSQGVQSRPWWLPRNKRTNNNNKKGPGHKAGPRACAISGRQWPREPGPGSAGRWCPREARKKKARPGRAQTRCSPGSSQSARTRPLAVAQVRRGPCVGSHPSRAPAAARAPRPAPGARTRAGPSGAPLHCSQLGALLRPAPGLCRGRLLEGLCRGVLCRCRVQTLCSSGFGDPSQLIHCI